MIRARMKRRRANSRAGMDGKGLPIEISWWSHLHVKDALWLEMTVILVMRPHTSNKERDPRVSWFVWIGDQQTDMVEVALGYVRRFSQEHGYRFDKQALMWTKPRFFERRRRESSSSEFVQGRKT